MPWHPWKRQQEKLSAFIVYGIRDNYPKYDNNGIAYADDDEDKWMSFKHNL